MDDLNVLNRQIEIFCIFVIDFNKINNSVKSMINSDNVDEQARAKRTHSIINEYMFGTRSIDDVIIRIDVMKNNERLNGLVNYVKHIANNDKDEMFQKLNSNLSELNQTIEIVKQKATEGIIAEIENEEVIAADPSVPISPDDLRFLNKIAKLSIHNTREFREANRDFNSFAFKSKIIALFSAKAYYFEQVFSNADVKIQKKIMFIIEEHMQSKGRKEEEMKSYKSLVDINILSDIDTLANKTASNVSDHQAFEAFTSILNKNVNENLIRKVLRENIIMTAMFNTNAKTIGNNYGFKKLFINAVYPYNEVVVHRFMQLMEVDQAKIDFIVKKLMNEDEFKKAYESYQKSNQTKLFIEFADELMLDINSNMVDDTVISKLIKLMDGFINREEYCQFILPQVNVLSMLNDIYYYIIHNGLEEKHPDLVERIMKFYSVRIKNELESIDNPFHVQDDTIIYSMTSSDIWYDINHLMADLHADDIDKIYLKYNEITFLEFSKGEKLIPLDNQVDHTELKYLPKNEAMIICSDVDDKNFDIYVFGLYSRIIRGLLKSRIHIDIKKIEGSGFRKKEIPGLEKVDEIKVRKVLIDYMTVKILLKKDNQLFVGVYKRKVESILKTLLEINLTEKELEQFVHIKGLESYLDIFKKKTAISRIYNKYKAFDKRVDADQLVIHSESFVNLVD